MTPRNETTQGYEAGLDISSNSFEIVCEVILFDFLS